MELVFDDLTRELRGRTENIRFAIPSHGRFSTNGVRAFASFSEGNGLKLFLIAVKYVGTSEGALFSELNASAVSWQTKTGTVESYNQVLSGVRIASTDPIVTELIDLSGLLDGALLSVEASNCNFKTLRPNKTNKMSTKLNDRAI
jgi:hypothetical protein